MATFVRAFAVAAVEAALLAVAAAPWMLTTAPAGTDSVPVTGVVLFQLPAIFALTMLREWAVLMTVTVGKPQAARWLSPLQGSFGVASLIAAMLSAIVRLSVVAAVFLTVSDVTSAPRSLATARDSALIVALAIGGFWLVRQCGHLSDVERGAWLISRSVESPRTHCAQVVSKRAPWGAPTIWQTLRAANGLALQARIQGVDEHDLYGVGRYEWRTVACFAGVTLRERELMEHFGIGNPTPLTAPWRWTSAAALIGVAAVLAGVVAPLVAISAAWIGATIAALVNLCQRRSNGNGDV